MRNQRVLLIIIYFLLSAANLSAQKLFYKTFSVQDGLPSITVYSSFQDSKGYMWFCTDAGVARYDGYDFKIFTSEDGLSGNEVFQIHEDYLNRIWFLTYNGTLSYFKDEKFYNKSNNDLLKRLSNFQETTSTFLSSFCSFNGDLFFSYRNDKVIKVSGDTFKIIPFDNTIYNIWEHDNSLWIQSSVGIHKLVQNDFKLILKIEIQTNYPRTLINSNSITYGVGNEVFTFDYTRVESKLKLDGDVVITSLSKDSKDQIVVCSTNGIYILDSSFNILSHEFKDNVVSDYQVDNEGNIWVSSLGNGLFFLTSSQLLLLQEIDGLKSNDIKSLFLDKDENIWVGQGNNELQFIDKNGGFSEIPIGYSPFREGIKRIRFGLDNELLFVSKSGIQIKRENKWLNLPVRANDILYYKGRYYVGNTWFQSFSIHDMSNPDSLRVKMSENRLLQKRVNAISIGKSNELLLAAIDGIYNYNVIEKKINKVALSSLPSSCEVTNIKYIKESDLLIVGTAQHGVFLYKRSKLLKRFSVSSGLNAMYCTDLNIVADDLWISTYKGVSQVNLKDPNLVCSDINAVFGLPDIKVSQSLVVKDKLYLATELGILIISNPSTTKKSETNPRVHIEEIFINSKLYSEVNSLDLSHVQNSISFSYKGLSFRDFGSLDYYYRLIGSFDDWRKTKLTTLNFESLPPGEYIFELYTVNGQGLKSETKQLSFKIATPFYKEAWFVLLLIGVALLITVIVWKERLKRIEKDYQTERVLADTERGKLVAELDLAKTKSDLHRIQLNPHFIYNSINSIYPFLYDKSDPNKAAMYLSNLSQMIRDILESSFESTWKVKDELAFIERYVAIQNLKMNSSVELVLNLNSKVENIIIPSLITQTFIENSFVHGFAVEHDDMRIMIYVEIENKYLIIRLEDNGTGITNSAVKQKHISRSSIIVQERLISSYPEDKIGNDFLIQGKLDSGYFVQIKLPLHEDDSNN